MIGVDFLRVFVRNTRVRMSSKVGFVEETVVKYVAPK